MLEVTPEIRSTTIADGFYVVACLGSQIVGMVCATYDERNPEQVEMDTIHVEKQHRGKGIGPLMFNSLVSCSQEAGAKYITGNFRPETGWETGALRFYEKVGVNVEGGIFINI